MKTFLLAAAITLAALATTGPAAAQQDALAPAREGQFLCTSPNVMGRTCGSLAAYTARPDGSYARQAQILIAQDPVVIMVVSSNVTLRDGAVCGSMTRQHVQAAQFAIDGQRASDENAAYLREQITQTPGFLSTETCTTFTVSPDGLIAQDTVNGAPNGNGAQVKWVRAAEGYRVAP